MSFSFLALRSHARTHVASIATVAQLGVLVFAASIVALHAFRPDDDPVSQPTSVYAVGSYGSLMTLAFFSMSVATLALVVGLYHGMSRSGRSRIGLVLLVIWGVGVLIAMLFPIDLEDASRTTSGTVHLITGRVIFLCVTVGTVVLSLHFRRDARWRPLRRPALVLALVMVAGFAATLFSNVTDAEIIGLTQRIVLIALVAWMLLVASRLRAIGRASGAKGAG